MLIIFTKSSDMLPRVDSDLAKVLFQIEDGDRWRNNLWVHVIPYDFLLLSIFIGDTLKEFLIKSNDKEEERRVI